jgi:hypothetical protein
VVPVATAAPVEPTMQQVVLALILVVLAVGQVTERRQ